jgi:hypothetical protein
MVSDGDSTWEPPEDRLTFITPCISGKAASLNLSARPRKSLTNSEAGLLAPPQGRYARYRIAVGPSSRLRRSNCEKKSTAITLSRTAA